MNCLVCDSGDTARHSVHDGIGYFKCRACGSIFVDRDQLQTAKRPIRQYDEGYWREEVKSAESRSFGSSINRVAETFLYARIPIENFIDIGAGPGYLLDALQPLLPEFSDNLWGIEAFPPPIEFRTTHPNYIIGTLSDLQIRPSAGVCIEVIEHLYPEELDNLLSQLAVRCEPQALFYFNSAQPEFVDECDPGYLDPFGRGHIISYSIEGLRSLFLRHGFSLIRLPGREWGFLAEYQSTEERVPNCDDLLARLWTPHQANLETLQKNRYGQMIHTMGVESARCYLEADRFSRK